MTAREPPGEAQALFPAPAPPGITPADLDFPDPAWKAAARARRSS